jgi:hypothetical protein
MTGKTMCYQARVGSRAERRYLVKTLALIVVLPYSFVGVERLINGGVEIFVDDTLLRYIAAASDRFHALPAWLHVEELRYIMMAGFALVTVFEVTSACLLLSRRYRAAWLIVMTCFHAMTLVSMNILFWENMVIAACLFWPGWRIRRRPR